MLNKSVTCRVFICFTLILSSFSVMSAGSSSAKQSDVQSFYSIGPGDVLSISVWKEEGMQLEVLVRPDVGITFPLAGEIKAGGLTTKALSDTLVEKLKKYIPNPSHCECITLCK